VLRTGLHLPSVSKLVLQEELGNVNGGPSYFFKTFCSLFVTKHLREQLHSLLIIVSSVVTQEIKFENKLKSSTLLLLL